MKAIKSNTTSRRQIMISIVLLILIIGLGAGFFVVRTQLDIRDQAAGPVCQIWNFRCSWNSVPGVTEYEVVVRDPSGKIIPNTTISKTSVEFKGSGGVTYTCTVTALSHTNPDCPNLPSSSGTGFCASIPGPGPSTTATPTPTVPIPLSSVTVTVTPSASGTPTATPGPGTPTAKLTTGTPTSTLRPGVPSPTPTKTPTPTPTTIKIGGTGVTTAPSPLPTSGQIVATSAVASPTTVTSLPESGIFTPTIFVLIIGVMAILLPLVF